MAQPFYLYEINLKNMSLQAHVLTPLKCSVALLHRYIAWKVPRWMRPAVTQTRADVESLTLPCGELSYYSSAVSGQLSSNYCTLMAGPITDRLIAWSLPYVQPAVMLIHLFTHRRPRCAAFHAAQMYHNTQAGKCVKVNWDRRSRLTNNFRF